LWCGIVIDIDDESLFKIIMVVVGLTCDGLVIVIINNVDIDVLIDDVNVSPPAPAPTITSVASTWG
jgi:hypothetical protein